MRPRPTLANGRGPSSKINPGEGRRTSMSTCMHLATRDNTPPRTTGCEECLAMGDSWVHLRRCMQCGHVGCCDSSKNKHATQHFHTTGHPVVQSFEPGE